jgi:anti-sigma regulatory factor (Ser/Thr protein kinase)
LWLRRLPPPVGDAIAAWHRRPGSVAELSLVRRQLREAMRSGALPARADDEEDLLLAVEELASNGLRHGRPPVEVGITATAGSWLLRVSDAATDRPPEPAIGRDPGLGGMGLTLVGRLCRAHGWSLDGDRKVVWAEFGFTTSTGAASGRRSEAMATALGLATRLTTTATQVAATMDAIAADAAAAGRSHRARSCRALALRARLEAERARGISLAPAWRSTSA